MEMGRLCWVGGADVEGRHPFPFHRFFVFRKYFVVLSLFYRVTRF